MKAEDSIKMDSLTKELADCKRRCDNQTGIISALNCEIKEKEATIKYMKEVDSCSCTGWKIATLIVLLYELFKFFLS
jgi:hypothetical protein